MSDFAKEIQTRCALQEAQENTPDATEQATREALRRNQAEYAQADRAANFIAHPSCEG